MQHLPTLTDESIVGCFDDNYNMDVTDVDQINTEQAMYLRIGDVVMVNSLNVPELGPHFIVVVGGLVAKPHGIKPETVSMPASKESISLLDLYDPYNGVVALKLRSRAKEAFYAFYGITSVGDNIKIPIRERERVFEPVY
jgi:hypothetical protein